MEFWMINLNYSLGKFSRRQSDFIFLIFPCQQDLKFHANDHHWEKSDKYFEMSSAELLTQSVNTQWIFQYKILVDIF